MKVKQSRGKTEKELEPVGTVKLQFKLFNLVFKKVVLLYVFGHMQKSETELLQTHRATMAL